MNKFVFSLFGIFIFSTSIFAQGLKPILKTGGQKLDLNTIEINMSATDLESGFNTQVQFQPNFDFKGEEHLHGAAKVWQFDKHNKPAFIEQKQKLDFRSLQDQPKLIKYFEQLSPILKIDQEDIELSFKGDWVDKIGNIHYKVNQQLNGIDIYGAEMILHEDENILSFFNGHYFESDILKQAILEENTTIEQATELVMEQCTQNYLDLEAQDFPLPNDFKQVEKQKVFYMHEGKLRLAYYINIHPNFGEWFSYFIDAANGKILNKYSNVCSLHCKMEVGDHAHNGKCTSLKSDAKKINNTKAKRDASRIDLENLPPDGPAETNATDLLGNSVPINSYELDNEYFMIDASRDMYNSFSSSLPNNPAGAVLTLDGKNTSPMDGTFDFSHITSFTNFWSDRGAVSAHYNGGLAYEYFINTHGHNSIDGDAGNIPSFVNVAGPDGSSMGNAFWSSIAIFYGNGNNSFKEIARALDVSGHEMSHGVVQNTANLEYMGESGAINESFADAFGAMLDRDDWLIGEDCVRLNAYPSGALRDMSDPHNGQSTNNFNAGWQPKHVNEMYTGELDNGGVHWNSGIPNHAYYLIATAIGKDKAEMIYYHALTNYLTKSSQFADLRIAVIKSADDLCGNAEIAAVESAFDQVGIGSGGGGNYQQDASENPGSDLILYTNSDFEGVYLMNSAGELLANPLSPDALRSRPSVSDDGSRIVYVGSDNKMYGINIDWTASTFEVVTISDQEVWRNVVISKDGNRLAALTDEVVNEIFVYDFILDEAITFELYNPTYTEGVTTGDVLFADILEFDLTSNYIMYDAANEISSNDAEPITYWDMGLIKVWDEDTNDFDEGQIVKLFPSLSQGVSIGNPTFAKNSPYVIAFDLISEDTRQIVGANLETGETGLIFNNSVLGYPSFSKSDDQIIFNLPAQTDQRELGVLNMNADKISAPTPSSTPSFFNNFVSSRWGVWFANGDRILSKIENVKADDIQYEIFPNPVNDQLHITLSSEIKPEKIEIHDLQGRKISEIDWIQGSIDQQINTSTLMSGIYIVSLYTKDKKLNRSFVKL